MTLSRSGAASVVGLTGGQLFERSVGLFAWLCGDRYQLIYGGLDIKACYQANVRLNSSHSNQL